MMALGAMCDALMRDVSNVLCAVVGFSQLMQDEIASHEVVSMYARQIERAGRYGNSLAERVQAFASRQPHGAEQLDLYSEIQQLLPLVEGLMHDHVRIGVDVASERPSVCVDPALLEELVVALSLHARDQMPDGGHLRWFVRAPDSVERRRCAPGSRVILEVLDTGVRSPPEAPMRRVVAAVVGAMGGELFCERGHEPGNRLRCLLPAAP